MMPLMDIDLAGRILPGLLPPALIAFPPCILQCPLQ